MGDQATEAVEARARALTRAELAEARLADAEERLMVASKALESEKHTAMTEKLAHLQGNSNSQVTISDWTGPDWAEGVLH
eukprot:1553147-Pyramimonas_sp.AAC.1